jgi:arabinogalactan endo-1,4-beta-galactosidase
LPPTISKSFGAASVALHGSTSLTFALRNPNGASSLSGIAFADTLPTGLVVTTPNGVSGSCGGGSIRATAGSDSISLADATLEAGGSCTFALNISAIAAGTQNNTTDAVTSTEGGSGKTASASITVAAASQQPAEPTDITPLDGEVYYVLNQLSGLEADLNNNSATAGDHVVQDQRSFTNLGQRWAFTKVSGFWRISNIANGFCFDSAASSGATYVVQNPCATVASQQWTLAPTSNGYYTISNTSTKLVIDLYQGSLAERTFLDQTALSGNATQSQQWLLRPAFFRGVDNALLEKQEAARASSGLVWWTDASRPQDVLEIFKNHGVNMVRLRPSTVPPYANASQAGCSGNACYAETEAQDLDLAKRAKNLGMSVELTMLFDGGSSSSVPLAWANDNAIAQLQTDLYNYVKAEIMSYRQAGAIPDLVSIGNEVDTGFLGNLGSPTAADFVGFAALQIRALQAVKDAAADATIGPAIPAPLTCIHITPAWDLTQFFTLANQNNIAYDAICQSYYPFFHGPLTDAQAALSNPNNKPVEQDVLVAAANNVGKPIFIIETGEHYENGFASDDAWYTPPTPAVQRQFLLDLENVEKGLPNNLGMGFAYWDPAGVNIPNLSGGFVNGDNLRDAIYLWNGLTLFDNADASGTTNVSDSNYSALLPGVDALGGRLDPTLSYKFVNRNSGLSLSVFHASTAAGAMLDVEADNGNPTLNQQWRVTSNNDGYFAIASLNPGANSTTNVLDDADGSMASGNVIIQSPGGSTQELEWAVVSAGNGYFSLVNRASGLVLDMRGGVGAQAGFAVQEPQNSGRTTQQWQIVPVH